MVAIAELSFSLTGSVLNVPKCSASFALGLFDVLGVRDQLSEVFEMLHRHRA
jgi:hypothetical protein